MQGGKKYLISWAGIAHVMLMAVGAIPPTALPIYALYGG